MKYLQHYLEHGTLATVHSTELVAVLDELMERVHGIEDWLATPMKEQL